MKNGGIVQFLCCLSVKKSSLNVVPARVYRNTSGCCTSLQLQPTQKAV